MLEYNDETFEYYMKLAEILYGDISDGGLTFEEKGIVLGVTRERIRQIEKTAIAKLKHPRINYKLRQYIDKEYGNE
jgi:DNA-directed RNA polymerase sigma subunit (sigma70/sigma32)